MKIKILALLPLVSSAALAQGPLQPVPDATNPRIGPIPPISGGGLPQPTMKTLHQVEPRTPLIDGQVGISFATSTIVITQPGSYYLTRNIEVSSGTAILINASGVTLDLNGYNISSTASPPNGYGISISGNAVTVKNGNIYCTGVVTGTGSEAAFSGSGFTHGIYGYVPYQLCISSINISGVSLYGIYTDLEGGTVVDACTVRNSARGITAPVITNSTATAITGTAIDGRSISNCMGYSFGGNGINGMSVTNSNGTSLAATNLWAGINATAGTVTNSRGDTTGAAWGIRCYIATGCFATSSSITYKYNMP